MLKSHRQIITTAALAAVAAAAMPAAASADADNAARCHGTAVSLGGLRVGAAGSAGGACDESSTSVAGLPDVAQLLGASTRSFQHYEPYGGVREALASSSVARVQATISGIKIRADKVISDASASLGYFYGGTYSGSFGESSIARLTINGLPVVDTDGGPLDTPMAIPVGAATVYVNRTIGGVEANVTQRAIEVVVAGQSLLRVGEAVAAVLPQT